VCCRGRHTVAHFEKVRRFGPFLKRLAVISECRAMITAYQRHTRPSPTSACGPVLSLVWRDCDRHAAKALGLTVPETLLATADEVIQ
jgi:hypothetical protein